MLTTTTPHEADYHALLEPGLQTGTPLARAWISIVLVPVFFFLSFATQSGIYALTGHDPSAGVTPPLWANLAAGLPGLAIALIPCVAAVVLGRRATAAGVRSGSVPAVIGTLLGAGLVVLLALNL